MVKKMIKYFFLLILLTVLVTVKMMRDSEGTREIHGMNGTTNRNFLKIVHLDLKGAPPRMSYLLSLLPLVKSAGGNGFLIEYEDMFPFTGNLRNISSRMPYKLEEIAEFVTTAENSGMEVIPLVQTFGHLEYVLKLDEFRHLREDPNSPQEICPSKNEAVVLVKEMIRQVMEVHRNAKYIHIGCDEVREIGKCPACSRKRPKTVFSRHIYRMGSFVRATYPGVVPLIWDDMLRRWSIYDVQDSGFTSVVEPVVWVYGEEIPPLVPHYAWYIYFKSFPRIWAASAFKGATSETQVIPDLSLHFENNLSWMKFIKNRRERVDTPPDMFGGVIITGWSRYDHFALLCELLPAGVPSLILNLVLVDRNFNSESTPIVQSDRYVFLRWMELLQCPRNVPEGNQIVIKTREYQSVLGVCNFPGSVIYRLASEYVQLRERLKAIVQKVESSAWVSAYNLRKNFTNPWRVGNVLTDDFEDVVFKAVGLLKSSFYDSMGEFYEDFVVTEWVEQNIDPMEDKLNGIYKNLKDLMKRNVWPRRPLT